MNIFKSIGNFFSNIFMSIKNATFLKDGLSIDETKVSAMIIVFLIATMFALGMYYLHGDITINLLNLLSYLIFGITGVNVVDKVVSKIGTSESTVQKITEDVINAVSAKNPENIVEPTQENNGEPKI